MTGDHFRKLAHEEIDRVELPEKIEIKRGAIGFTFHIEEGKVSAKIREKEIEQVRG